MSPRSLTRWDLLTRTIQQTLPQRKNIRSFNFSSLQLRFQVKGLAKHMVQFQQRNNSSNIVESPHPKIDIPQILIPELIWETVDRYPEATAVKCGVSGRLYSYGDVQKLSRRFMNSLIKAGFSHGDVVAVVLPNCPEFAIVTLGALEADMTVSFTNHVYTAEVNQATDYVKTALDTDEVVIFTDRIQRSAFILAQDIIDGFEMPFKPYVFGQEPHAKEIEKLLEKMTDNAELPHIFYKKAYVAGSRALGMQYESGELEERLGVVPYMEMPKMYPDETDYALRKTDFEKEIY